MAQLPTSFSAPQSNISDGSDLIRTAMGLNGEINAYGNKAFSTITDFATQQANQALAQTFASNIANGKDPTSALGDTLGKVNSWTSADAINKLLLQRNYEQESLRKEALLNINKAQERRTAQNWLGENEAAEANLLLGTGYNTNNSNVYNQGLTKASGLSDIGKKYVKMSNLAAQQDQFANSAVSRNYSKALTDQIADKKLVAQLDARFRVLESQNPTATKAQVAQTVAQEYNLSPDQVNQLLNEHQYASGQSLLKEASSYLSNVLDPKTVEAYEKAQETSNKYALDINTALYGDTEQNKADRGAAIDMLSGELSGLTDTHPTDNRPYYYGGVYGLAPASAPSIVPKDKAQELISGLINNPTPENLEKVKEFLSSIGSKGTFVDFIDSNFTVENGKVTFTPDAANNINEALGKQIMESAGGKTRSDVVSQNTVDMDRLDLSIKKAELGETYNSLLTLAKEGKLTTEDQEKLKKLNSIFIKQKMDTARREGRVADATSVSYPITSLSQTVESFGELLGSGKQIFAKDLIDKGMPAEMADDVLERIDDVTDQALSSEKYKHISREAIILAVLNKATKADDWLSHTDADYIKEAMKIDLYLPSVKSQNSLIKRANELIKTNNAINSSMTLNGKQ